MSEVATGKRYQLSNEEKAKLFMKSKYWQDVLKTKFRDWGSKDEWSSQVNIAGTRANMTYHNIIEQEIQALRLKDFQEAKAKKAAVDKQKAENTQNNKAREPSVFSKVQIEKELKV